MLKMTFESGRGPVEVEIDDRHYCNGRAYFRKDDMFADVVDGEFTAPMSEVKYRVLLPTPRNVNGEAVLEIRTWRTVARSSVFDATSGT